MVWVVFLIQHIRRRGRKFIIKMPYFKMKCLYFNVDNNFLFFFFNLKARNTVFKLTKGISFKMFLGLNWLPLSEPASIKCMERATLVSSYLASLVFFPICNNVFSIIDQCRYFFNSLDKTLIFKLFLSNAYILDL